MLPLLLPVRPAQPAPRVPLLLLCGRQPSLPKAPLTPKAAVRPRVVFCSPSVSAPRQVMPAAAAHGPVLCWCGAALNGGVQQVSWAVGCVEPGTWSRHPSNASERARGFVGVGD